MMGVLIAMSVQEQIRRLDAEGVPARQIARDLGISRESVTKYVAVDDYSPKPAVVSPGPCELADAYQQTDDARGADGDPEAAVGEDEGGGGDDDEQDRDECDRAVEALGHGLSLSVRSRLGPGRTSGGGRE